MGMGDSLKALMKYKEASDSYTIAIKLHQSQHNQNYDIIQAYLKRGLSLYKCNNLSKACSDLQLVLKKEKHNVRAHFYLGKVYSKLDRL